MKTYFFIILTALASTMAFKNFTEPIDGMIVGGSQAARGEFPHMVWIQIGSSYAYGGSIVDADSVLTAGHCCQFQPFQYTIISGDHVRNESHGSEQRKEVSQIFRHPSYNSITLANDICILRTSTPFNMDRWTAPATLATSGSTPSGNLEVIGWGAVSDGGSTSQILLKVTVPFVDDPTCKAAYGANKIHLGMICAGAPGRDACQGDGGSPIHQGNTVVGVVSFGTGCGANPGVYSSVGYFRQWIDTIIRPAPPTTTTTTTTTTPTTTTLTTTTTTTPKTTTPPTTTPTTTTTTTPKTTTPTTTTPTTTTTTTPKTTTSTTTTPNTTDDPSTTHVTDDPTPTDVTIDPTPTDVTNDSTPTDATADPPTTDVTADPPTTEATDDPPTTDIPAHPPTTDVTADPPTTEVTGDPPTIEPTDDPPTTDITAHPPTTDVTADPPTTEATPDPRTTDITAHPVTTEATTGAVTSVGTADPATTDATAAPPTTDATADPGCGFEGYAPDEVIGGLVSLDETPKGTKIWEARQWNVNRTFALLHPHNKFANAFRLGLNYWIESTSELEFFLDQEETNNLIRQVRVTCVDGTEFIQHFSFDIVASHD